MHQPLSSLSPSLKSPPRLVPGLYPSISLTQTANKKSSQNDNNKINNKIPNISQQQHHRIQKFEQKQKQNTISIVSTPRSINGEIKDNYIIGRNNKNIGDNNEMDRYKKVINLQTAHTDYNINLKQNSQSIIQSKTLNINLQNTIPSLLKKINNYNNIHEERKHKIFQIQQNTQFQIPLLQQYYSKQTLKSNQMKNGNNSMSEQLSNRAMNASYFSFFDFMNGEKNTSNRDKKIDFSERGTKDFSQEIKNIKNIKNFKINQNQNYQTKEKDQIKEGEKGNGNNNGGKSQQNHVEKEKNEEVLEKDCFNMRRIGVVGFLFAIIAMIIINYYI